VSAALWTGSCGTSLLTPAHTQNNDQMLVVYLSSLIRAVIALHALVDNRAENARGEEEGEGAGGDKEKEEKEKDKGEAAAGKEKKEEKKEKK